MLPLKSLISVFKKVITRGPFGLKKLRWTPSSRSCLSSSPRSKGPAKNGSVKTTSILPPTPVARPKKPQAVLIHQSRNVDLSKPRGGMAKIPNSPLLPHHPASTKIRTPISLQRTNPTRHQTTTDLPNVLDLTYPMSRHVAALLFLLPPPPPPPLPPPHPCNPCNPRTTPPHTQVQ